MDGKRRVHGYASRSKQIHPANYKPARGKAQTRQWAEMKSGMGIYSMTTTSLMYIWMALFVAMVETGLETICLTVYHNDCKIRKIENAAPK